MTFINRPIPRPKILSPIVVPTGGWDLDFTVSVSASLDTALTATVPAGTYYIAWDNTDDDLLRVISAQMRSACSAHSATMHPTVYLDTLAIPPKVAFGFLGSGFTGTTGNDVEMNWTSTNASLAAALGFKTTSDRNSTTTDNPTFTADYVHSYGWYATEDGQLVEYPERDFVVTMIDQDISLAGNTATQDWATYYESFLRLDWLTRDQTWSKGVEYTGTPLHPYQRDEGLECWWHACKYGAPFRLYRHETRAQTVKGNYTRSDHIEIITITSSDTTTITDSNRAWATDPQTYKGMLLEFDKDTASDTTSARERVYIESHTATAITTPNANPSGGNWRTAADGLGFIYDGRYRTYVVDMERMSRFAPTQRSGIDRWGIEIPLRKYIA